MDISPGFLYNEYGKMASKLTVALLFGGRSAEHDVSLSSAAAVFRNLDKSRFQVRSLYINRQGEWCRVDSPLLAPQELELGPFRSFLPWQQSAKSELEADIYFPVLHGPYGEDGTIQGLLEMADVAFVGAGVLSSAIAMDKAVAKLVFASRKLPIGKFTILYEEDWRNAPELFLSKLRDVLALPFFVKPANLGSSVGITKVNNFADTGSALEIAFQYDRKILVEEGILGREIECSVLGNTQPRASLPGEVIPFREFYDYADKYLEGKTGFGIPADLPEEISQKIQSLAVEAFKAVEGWGMARVDFFIEQKSGKIFLNELNTIPGFTQISMYPKLWEASGIPFSRLLEDLIQLGLERHRQKKRKTS